MKTWVFLRYFVSGCSSSHVFSNVYSLIRLISERWFDKVYHLVVHNNLYILVYTFYQYLLHILMESFYEKRSIL